MFRCRDWEERCGHMKYTGENKKMQKSRENKRGKRERTKMKTFSPQMGLPTLLTRNPTGFKLNTF